MGKHFLNELELQQLHSNYMCYVLPLYHIITITISGHGVNFIITITTENKQCYWTNDSMIQIVFFHWYFFNCSNWYFQIMNMQIICKYYANFIQILCFIMHFKCKFIQILCIFHSRFKRSNYDFSDTIAICINFSQYNQMNHFNYSLCIC